MDLALGARSAGDLAERRRILAEVQRNAVEARSDPDHLPARAQRIELLGPVLGHAAGQELSFPERDRDRECLKWNERFAQRRLAVDSVPGGQEARERRGLDGLDFTAKRGERGAAKAT